MYCRKCKMHTSSPKFCGVCGSKTIESEVVCPHSVNAIEQHMCWLTDRFCRVCGKPVQEEMNLILKGGSKDAYTNT